MCVCFICTYIYIYIHILHLLLRVLGAIRALATEALLRTKATTPTPTTVGRNQMGIQ